MHSESSEENQGRDVELEATSTGMLFKAASLCEITVSVQQPCSEALVPGSAPSTLLSLTLALLPTG